MANQLLYKIQLVGEIKKVAIREGLPLIYEVREHPNNKEKVNLWWDEPNGEERYSTYRTAVVNEKIKQGHWEKIR